ncbi:TolC family protein [Flavobacterium sp.]|uniref:TolC family protein n=1 Tax=Flavobacterium sp. TaxID=239 RepID=UPI00260BBB77|nr:TolC family protein [Flavobacterium sp.]MDG2431972.1 TolC family protein [Flavobacterium sp.]
MLIIVSNSTILAQESKAFSSLNEVLEFSKSKNYVFQNAKFQTQLASLTKKTAIGNVFNPKMNTSAQALNNINQQVSFLPAEAFGGVSGSFKEVVIGQQYVSTFNIQPQFDILNLSAIAQIKSAKINEQLVENQNKINEQNLYDKINAVYFNILSFNGQKEILNENLSIAETILKIVYQKYNEGIARKQEVNEAEVNFISIKDKLEQLEMNTKIQYQILDLFFENTIKAELKQTLWSYENQTNTLTTNSNLQTQNIDLQKQLTQQEHKSLLFQNLPVLSFVSSFNWQNLSNTNFFASGSNWQNFNYIGLKLGWELPTVQRLSNTKSKQIQLETLKNNVEHSIKETNNSNEQMVLEYEKSLLQIINYKKIYELKKDTYEKNFNQFKENILPLDKLLISQNDMLISKINVITVLANVGFNVNKIEINNKF